MKLPELAQLRSAQELVYETLRPTPQFAWPKIKQRLGRTVWIKHENLTPTGAFKVRGGLVYMQRLRPGSAVITATRGNHGQSIAFAARRAGVMATIYVPFGNSPDQNSAMRALGANVIEFGRDFEEARVEADRVASMQGLHYIPSFHGDLVAGVASYALELFDAVPNLDTVYVAVGMGSGICGLIAARNALGLGTRIVGVNAEGAMANAQSFRAGRVVPTEAARTFADGIATRKPNDEALAIMLAGVAEFITVTDDDIAEAMRVLYDDTHHVAEGAAAAALAAAMLDAHRRPEGAAVGVIISGGNIERQRLLTVLSGGTPAPPG